MPDSVHVNEGQPAEQQLRRSQAAIIRVAACWSLWSATTLGNVASLFIMRLGGQEFHVGLVSALSQGSWWAQLAGLKLLPRFGKVGLALMGRLGAAGMMLFLMGLAVGGAGLRPTAAVTLALLIYGVMMIVHTTGGTGWWPLLQDNSSEGEVGAFFARIRRWLRLVEIVMPVAVGTYLGGQPQPARFLAPFGVGLAAILTGAYLVRRVRERPTEDLGVPLLIRLRLAARIPSIRRYLVFVFQLNFLVGMVAPLWAAMFKKHLDLPSSFIVLLGSFIAVGHLSGLRLWARMVDRHGGRSVLTFSLFGTSLLGLSWLGLPREATYAMVWGVGFFLLWGFFEGGIMMGRSTAMLSAVPAVYQSNGLTLAMITWATGGALGSLVGGAVFQWIAAMRASVAGIDAKLLYLAGVQVLMLLSWLPSRRLHGHVHQTPTRQLMAAVWQRMIDRFRPR